ncbi:DUF2164 domain-containing protein [Pseudoalteromonas sp. GABNS16A]|uniref:DUF2164 domain-containing protein n=1 Tax=Pseudoalteromonas sp. GABNS16A TaxID=3025321 RepID=UPI0023584249|nr:DUF2164 domain-containing protein [Pseudoalteromonas sp. GABNS16A]MDC9575654.1 DUF2164 domain-containing protein [Pseudoalteromonas sp. GABNS16A]
MMSDITFSPDQKARMVSKIKAYFEDELGQDIGGFEAEFLIDFFATELGAHFYNRASV